jgi:hypothetical protein
MNEFFRKAKNIEFTILVKGKWICPYCGEIVEIQYNASPYREIAEDPTDEMCPKCKEFFTLNFYEDED